MGIHRRRTTRLLINQVLRQRLHQKLFHPLFQNLTIKLPKGVIHKSTFNPRARAAHNYNIVEDLA